MKGFFAALASFAGSIGIGLLIMLLCYAISWIATCGVIYLITLIFGWTFNWLIATGIWLILCVIKWVIRGNK